MCRRITCQAPWSPSWLARTGRIECFSTALDSLIPQHKLPVLIAISIGNGSGDAQGSERGLEYDTMSGRYAEFVEHEVLPLVEEKAHVKVDPRSRWPGDHGRQFRRIVRVDYGLVPS